MYNRMIAHRYLLLAALLLAVLLLATPAAVQALDTGPETVLSAGTLHTCALKPDGSVDCWGNNDYGQADDQPGPFTQLSAGSYHTCGLKPDGAADCWGDNSYGQADDQPGPFTQLSANWIHTCGLKPDGAVDCWGNNDNGQAADQPGPFTQVSAGPNHTCGLKPDGSVDCWGHNGFGQSTDQPGPFTQLSADQAHTCGLKPDGSIDCWGLNGSGQADDQPGPFTQLSVGYNHTCALKPDGSVDCWGNNDYGQADDQPGPYGPYDTVSPSVTVEQAAGQADPTSSSPILFTVTFSEPVSGFGDSAADVILSGTAGATTAAVSGGPVTYDVSVSGMAVSGTVTAEIPAGAVIDAVANPNSASASTDNIVTYAVPDTTAPDTSIGSSPANPTNNSSAAFTFSGADDLTPPGSLTFECDLDGGGFTACASPQNYNGLTDGAHTFEVRAIDTTGNVDLTQASYTWTIDTIAPSVTINQVAGQSDPTSTNPIHFTATFSEPINGLGGSSLVVSGTALVNSNSVIGSNPGSVFAIESVAFSSGTVTVSIPAGVTTDAAGNGNTASTSTDNTVTYVLLQSDLTLSKSHSGNFTQGGSGSYSLLVSNTGTGATSGTVTVTDSLPAGMTATALSGTGWSCTLASLTCTRADALASGSSFDPITLTVSVAANAPASLTNTAAVSGGSDSNPANNSATDPTTINPLPVVSTGQITPANVLCSPFAAGTAANLTEIKYTVKSNRVFKVNPLSFNYYSKVTAPAATFTLKVSQSNPNGWGAILPPLAVVYNAQCKAVAGTVSTSSGTITVQVKKATPGAVYYLGVNYQPISLIGRKVNAPYPTVPYTFITSLNNTPIATNSDQVALKPQ